VKQAKGRLGILVGGGPAPGINGVISAATIEAINDGLEVVGIYDGFRWLMRGDTTHVLAPLTIDHVSRIHFKGGSMLRTARDNPTREEKHGHATIESLLRLDIRYLITIGGDDTAFAAAEICRLADGRIRIAHVPKTIDNDIPLPGNMPTFGFQTARHVGTQPVLNLMEDSRTTNRWYFVVVMGRKAGHLALGIGKAAGATLIVISEEFPQRRVTIDDVCRVLEGAIYKRRAAGHDYGTAVIAEGVGEKIDTEELRRIPGVQIEVDPYGHIRLAEVPLAMILKRRVIERLHGRGDKITIVDNTLGYELRCADPIPFDCEYVRDLGYGAVRYLLGLDGWDAVKHGALVCLERGRLVSVPFDELRDPDTGRTRVRLVDIHTESYEVARKYMIRLQREDLENPESLESLARAASMKPAAFRAEYEKTVGL
jgi:6-phosphofructokinase 1